MTMFTESDLKELLEYKAEYPVLSIYLNTDPSEGSADVYKLRLRSMLKDIDMKSDVNEVELFFDHEYDWSGRSAVIFSCEADNFFRFYSFEVPIDDRIRISERPHVKPLADLLDSYGGYGVALVDKQSARLFNFHLGELREQVEMTGESVRHTKRGGGSQSPGRRGGVAGQTDYTKEVAERNMKEAADFTASFFTENHVRRVLIGGTEDNIAAFRSQLPKAWQSLIVGTFPVSMNASQTDVMERAIEIGKEAEIRRKLKLIDTLVTNAAKGQGGVVGIEDTLAAVHDGRVQTLLVRAGYREAGYLCQGCEYITAQQLDRCTFCENKFEQIPDVVDLAVRRVLRNGGEVTVLHDFAEKSEFKNVGALTRY
jgi:peptide subunit release factor 1 (eRF1)